MKNAAALYQCLMKAACTPELCELCVHPSTKKGKMQGRPNNTSCSINACFPFLRFSKTIACKVGSPS